MAGLEPKPLSRVDAVSIFGSSIIGLPRPTSPFPFNGPVATTAWLSQPLFIDPCADSFVFISTLNFSAMISYFAHNWLYPSLYLG